MPEHSRRPAAPSRPAHAAPRGELHPPLRIGASCTPAGTACRADVFERKVRRLLRALGRHDRATMLHARRVAYLSVRVGATLGLGAEELRELRHAAFLHDAGKLLVPRAVLRKHATLSGEEWSVVRAHVRHGLTLALALGAPDGVLAGVLHHHERWDGSGYPDGLRGHEIPTVSRVLAACDVYDALTTRRPYKHAWTADGAQSEMRRLRYSGLDGDVVDALLRVLAG